MSASKKARLFLVYMVVGSLMAAVGLILQQRYALAGFVSSYGWVLLAVGLLKYSRFRAIAKDADRAREHDARQVEERTVFLTHKARSIVFFFSIYAQLLGSLVLFLLHQPLAGKILCYLTVAQCIAYTLLWRWLDRRY